MNSETSNITTQNTSGETADQPRAPLRTPFGKAGLIAILSLLVAGAVLAQAPSTPVLVASSGVSGPTLGIPRWKGYMSPTDPDKFWLSFANTGAGSNNMAFTTDAGTTWSSNTITIDAYMDFHLSLFGRNDDLYFTFPGVGFRRFASPAESISDAGPLVTLSGTSSAHRSNVMVQPNGRIWVFTRQGGTPSENVRYQYSDNGGANWTSSVAFSTSAPDIRIGSMPYVNGNPALVVLHLNDARGYEYYLWNGSSFQERPDHSVYAAYVGYDRSFTHNQISDTVFHLIFGDGSGLRHVWKNYASGSGAWNTSIIMNEANNGSIDWLPISTVHGSDLYVFYCRKGSADAASMRVYYRRWSQVTRTWGAEYQVSTQSTSRDPNTAFHVPASADYIPVFYSAGSGPYSIYFSKIAVTGQVTDTIPPGPILDLGATSGPGSGQVTLGWSAPGDDGGSGTSDSYDIRYAFAPLSESNWASAIPVGNAPDPASSGQPESFAVSNLPLGTVYFGIKSWDEAGNPSAMSNLALVLVTGVNNPDDNAVLPQRTSLTGIWPNPFNSQARIEYEVAELGRVEITVYNVLGQEVARLLNALRSNGLYQLWWDGTDSRGSPVASGIYFCRLAAENTSDIRKLVYLK
ncbi:MAG: T9SS type A sorting domain-containing protein [Candidatus Zixiibacteriota bacterium]